MRFAMFIVGTGFVSFSGLFVVLCRLVVKRVCLRVECVVRSSLVLVLCFGGEVGVVLRVVTVAGGTVGTEHIPQVF